MQEEVEKSVRQMAESVPEKLRSEVVDHLLIGFGIKNLSEMPHIMRQMISYLPDGRRKGQRWSDVRAFYLQFQIPSSSFSGGNQHPNNDSSNNA